MFGEAAYFLEKTLFCLAVLALRFHGARTASVVKSYQATFWMILQFFGARHLK